jgi:hypothetical protein
MFYNSLMLLLFYNYESWASLLFPSIFLDVIYICLPFQNYPLSISSIASNWNYTVPSAQVQKLIKKSKILTTFSATSDNDEYTKISSKNMDVLIKKNAYQVSVT